MRNRTRRTPTLGPVTAGLMALVLLLTACAPAALRDAAEGPDGTGAGLLLVPPDYDPARRYPVLVVLPYTGGTGVDFLAYYLFSRFDPQRDLQGGWEQSLRDYYPDVAQRRERGYFVLVPGGTGSRRDHGARGFRRAVERYEARIEAGLREAARRYPIDRRRVVLAGHSLGGDLAWALTLRHPERYAGAFVSGSRTSYRADDEIAGLAGRESRYYFAMGEHEREVRLRGLRQTLAQLEQAGVRYRFRRVPAVGHEPPARHRLARALDYVFHGPSPVPR